MKNIILLFLFLIPAFLFAQYPTGTNKSRLGYQTTGDGLIWRGVAADTAIKPRTTANAYFQLDTVHGVLRRYIATRGSWQTVSGGGGAGLTMPFDSITFNATTADPDTAELKYNADLETFVFGADGTTIEIGQKTAWYVKNQTGSTINKGTVVRASGTLGSSGRILISPMVIDGTVPARFLLGITASNIANGSDGYVIHFGKLRKFNTSAWADGAVLYVGAGGTLTATEPSPPNLRLPIAFVVHNHATNGILAIRIQTGNELHELHDVDTTGMQNNGLLTWNSSSQKWQAAAPDNDKSSTNEIQTLSFASPLLGISSGNNVDLSPILTGYVTGSGTNNVLPKWSATTNLTNSNLSDNNTAVSILNSKPFMLGQWTTAGRPSGTLGYTGFNTSNNYPEFYNGSSWDEIFTPWQRGSAYTYYGADLSNTRWDVQVSGIQTMGLGIIKDSDYYGMEVGESATKTGGFYWRNTLERVDFTTFSNAYPIAFGNNWLYLAPSGNVGLGTASPSYNLDVNVSQTVPTYARAYNPNTGANVNAGFLSQVEANASAIGVTAKGGASRSTYKILSANDYFLYNGTVSGNISILNDFASGNIRFAAGGSSSAQATLLANGNFLIGTTTDVSRRIHVSGEARIADLTTDPPTRIVGADGDGDLADITWLNPASNSLGIGVAPTQELDVNGDLRVRDSTRLATTPAHSAITGLLTRDANGWVGAASLAGGLSYWGGVLSASGVNTIYTASDSIRGDRYLEMANDGSKTTALGHWPSFPSRAYSNSEYGLLISPNTVGEVTLQNKKDYLTFYGTGDFEMSVNDGQLFVGSSNIGSTKRFRITSSGSNGNNSFRFDTTGFSITSTVILPSSSSVSYGFPDPHISSPSTASTAKTVLQWTGDGSNANPAFVDIKTEPYYTVTSTSSPQTLSSTTSDNLINQGSTQATFTLTFPASPVDGQVLKITYNNAITTLTLDGNGNTIVGSAVTTGVAGSQRAFKFYTGIGWIKLY